MSRYTSNQSRETFQYNHVPIYQRDRYPSATNQLNRAKSNDALFRIAEQESMSESGGTTMEETYFRLFAARNKSRILHETALQESPNRQYRKTNEFSGYAVDAEIKELKSEIKELRDCNSELSEQNQRLLEELSMEKKKRENCQRYYFSNLTSPHQLATLDRIVNIQHILQPKPTNDIQSKTEITDRQEVCDLLRRAEQEIRTRDAQIEELNRKLSEWRQLKPLKSTKPTEDNGLLFQFRNKLKSSESEAQLLKAKISCMEEQLSRLKVMVTGLQNRYTSTKDRLCQKQRSIDEQLRQTKQNLRSSISEWKECTFREEQF